MNLDSLVAILAVLIAIPSAVIALRDIAGWVSKRNSEEKRKPN